VGPASITLNHEVADAGKARTPPRKRESRDNAGVAEVGLQPRAADSQIAGSSPAPRTI
jgi:hypothetical protein